jgi:hypothetical protein
MTLLSGVKKPHTKITDAIGLELDEHGYPVTSPFGRTSNPLVSTSVPLNGPTVILACAYVSGESSSEPCHPSTVPWPPP